MKRLVYAQFQGTLTLEMMMDKDILILSDSGVFLITTEEHAVNYPDEEFDLISDYALQEYGIRWLNGRLISDWNYSLKSTM